MEENRRSHFLHNRWQFADKIITNLYISIAAVLQCELPSFTCFTQCMFFFLYFVLVMHLRASYDIYRSSSRHKIGTMNAYTIYCSFALHCIRIYHSLFRIQHCFYLIFKTSASLLLCVWIYFI